MVSSSKNYTNGRIYKILNYIDDACYVGSTCLSLSKRMAAHRTAANQPKEQHSLLYTKMTGYGNENFYIELIEAYPCENKEELRKREGHYIRELGTLNKNIAGRTHQEYSREHYQNNHEKVLAQVKEYRQNNREKELARCKEYHKANREAILVRKKKTYTCVCGSTCRIADKARHERAKKHQDFITNLDTTTQTES